MKTLDKKVLCIYHKKCLDGMLAAWVVGVHHGSGNVEFVAADYGDKVPDTAGRDVVLVDFTYKPEVLMPLIPEMHSLRIIDHHASSQREWEPHLRGLLYNPKVCVVFDENRSGCVMAWRHYMDEMTIPKVFLIVQDHDLWHFNMAGTAEIIAGLYANGFVRKEDWNAISTLVQSETLLTHVHDHGRIVLAAQRELLENLLPRNTTLTSFMGEHAIPMANVPYDYNSKAGEMLYEKYESAPFVITYEDWHSKGVRKFSLRSHPERGADVSVLARKMGGGGHIHAAGFILKFDDLLNYPELLTPGK